jgi:hypothetical protein
VRVPAYVLIPKNLKQPAPAMVDLHSHGGMFMFGKEKVMDLGANHPTMTEYHRENYDGRPTATALVRRGYVVITIDALMFGERRAVLDAEIKSGWDRSKLSLAETQRLNAQCRAKEATLVKALTFAGATWPGIVLRHPHRGLLITRPEWTPRGSAARAFPWAAIARCFWPPWIPASRPAASWDSCPRSAR